MSSPRLAPGKLAQRPAAHPPAEDFQVALRNAWIGMQSQQYFQFPSLRCSLRSWSPIGGSPAWQWLAFLQFGARVGRAETRGPQAPSGGRAVRRNHRRRNSDDIFETPYHQSAMVGSAGWSRARDVACREASQAVTFGVRQPLATPVLKIMTRFSPGFSHRSPATGRRWQQAA
jgi:hypothetical protein